MSGPKLSQAEIERMRQEKLERERLEALKRLQDAQEQYREVCNKLAVIKSNARELLDSIDVIYKADLQSNISRVLDHASAISVADKKNPDSYHDATRMMKAKIKEVSDELEGLFSKMVKRDTTDKDLRSVNASYQTFKSVVDVMGKEIKPVFLDFSSDYDAAKRKKDIEVLYVHFAALSKRNDAPDLQKLAIQASKKIYDILSDDKNSIDDKRVDSYLQSLINEEQELIRQWNIRRELLDDYFALAVITDTTPKEPDDFENEEIIRTEIKKLRYLYRKQDEMDYIADQINDAMVDLGYSFVTSKVLTKKDQGETDFSLYKADEKTGIAVYTDQTGAVMMRMTVLGDDPVITDDDREFSYQRQIDFCAGHPDLVNALIERGIFLKQKSYQEPDRKHTYKMDVSGHGTTKSDATADRDAGHQKVDRRRRRRANSKKVRTM